MKRYLVALFALAAVANAQTTGVTSTGATATSGATVTKTAVSSSVSSASSVKTTWGFDATTSAKITSSLATDTSVTITVPVIKDGAGQQVTNYEIVYGDQDLAMPEDEEAILMAKINLAATTKSGTNYEFSYTGGATEFKVKLSGLKAATTYNLYVTPKTASGTAGKDSEEITFKTETKGHSAATVSSSSTAGTDTVKDIMNASYSTKENSVTVTWKPFTTDAKVIVYTKKAEAADSDYAKVATVPGKDGKATFTVANAGNYVAKLVPEDANGQPQGEGVKVSVKVGEGAAPGVVTTPQVGPEDNVIFMLLVLMGIAYLAVRYSKR